MSLTELYTDIIKEHAGTPHNKHHLAHPHSITPGHNPSCGDDIELELALEGDVICDASFTGSGCAISQASVSIMTDMIRGRTIQEAGELTEVFLLMCRNEILTERQYEQLEEAAALKTAARMPARVKCAALPWHTLKQALRHNQP